MTPTLRARPLTGLVEGNLLTVGALEPIVGTTVVPLPSIGLGFHRIKRQADINVGRQAGSK